MRHLLASLAVLSAAAPPVAAQTYSNDGLTEPVIMLPTVEQMRDMVGFSSDLFGAAQPAPVTMDDLYQDRGTRFVLGRASLNADHRCRVEIMGDESQAVFASLNGPQKSVLVASLCAPDMPGFAFHGEDGAVPHVLLDMGDMSSHQRGWSRLTDQQRDWWIEYVRQHEEAHTNINDAILQRILAGNPGRWRYAELAADLTGLCRAWADVDSPRHGPWLQQRLINSRQREANSASHGVYDDLRAVARTDFALQCQQLGATLDPDAVRPAATQLAITRTLSIADITLPYTPAPVTMAQTAAPQ